MFQTVKVKVDYDLPLSEAVQKGNYYIPNKHVTDKFLSVVKGGEKEVEVVLFTIDHQAFADEIIAEMTKQNLRPANAQELLAIGYSLPNLQDEFPIIAFGSVAIVDGDPFVPYIDKYYSIRRLGMYWFNYDWYPFCRFAAVRK